MSRRLVVTLAVDPESGQPTVAEGDTACLVEWRNIGPRELRPSRPRHGHELTPVPRTNMSHTPKWEGWLGSTSGIDRTAHGAWRVEKLTPHEDSDLRDGEPEYIAQLVRVRSE